MSRVFPILVALIGCAFPTLANAAVTVRVDMTSQTMTVDATTGESYAWKISTGRVGYRTPNGTYRPQRLERFWRSRTYGMAPMPHSIFFHGGYAIHGTDEVRRLGRPASHGCIRLSPGNAAELYAMVQGYGRGATRIVVTGSAAQADGAGALPERRAPAARFARPRSEPAPIRPRLAPPRGFEDDFEEEPYPPVFPRWLFD